MQVNDGTKPCPTCLNATNISTLKAVADMREERALEARVVDAAMAWHCVAEPTETPGLKSYTIDAWNDRHQAFRDACDALAAFRARKGNAE